MRTLPQLRTRCTPRHDIVMRLSWLAVLTAALTSSACNDLTAPLPAIAGRYDYVARSSEFTAHNRQGTIEIVDENPRTARFDGTYRYTLVNGTVVTGRLTGAFVSPTRIWFRFLDDRLEYHEADYTGFGADGEIFFQTLRYDPSGTTFSLRAAPSPQDHLRFPASRSAPQSSARAGNHPAQASSTRTPAPR